MQRIYLLLLLCTLLLACRKEMQPDPPPLPEPNDSPIKVLWQIPIASDTSEQLAFPRAIVNGIPVFTNEYLFTKSAYISAFDPNSGQHKWTFDQFIKPVDGFGWQEITQIKDKIIVNFSDQMYSINGTDGTLVWANDVSARGGDADTRINAIGDYIFSGHHTGPVPQITSESLIRTHYLTGQYDTIFSVFASGDKYYDFIMSAAQWINPQGDTLLICTITEPWVGGASPPGNVLNRSHLYAWNLRTRQFDWQIENFDPDGIASQRPCVIEGNYAYLMGKESLYCFDLVAGTVKWSCYLAEQLSKTQPVLYNNLLIVQGSSASGMWAVDKTSGQIVWFNSNVKGQADRLTCFEGVVYFTGRGAARLYAVNATDGRIIWDEFSPNRKDPKTGDATWGDSNLMIDPERRVLYIADRYYFMAIRIP